MIDKADCTTGSKSRGGSFLSTLLLAVSGLLLSSPASAAWDGATAIDLASGVGNASAPHTVIDADGNGIAVWRQISSALSRQRIYVAHFEAGVWSSATTLDLLTDVGAAADPHVTTDATGTAIAVWQQVDNALARSRIYAARYDGSSWSIATAIDLGGGLGSAHAPHLAMDGSGKAMAVWYQSDGSRNRIYAARFDGTTWGTPFAIDADSGVLSALDPRIGIDGSGNALAVWQQWNSTDNRYRIYANRFDGTSWGTPTTLDSATQDGNAFSPEIAVNASGRSIAVWYQDSDSEDDASIAHKRIYSAIYTSGWGTATTIDNECDESIVDDPETEEVESCTAVALGDAFLPKIAINSSNEAVVVWYQENTTDGRQRIQAVRYDGNAWSDTETIDSDDIDTDAFDPQVSLNDSGNSVAVWYQSTGSRNRIHAALHNGGAWDAPTTIDLATSVGDAYFPQVAMNGTGTILAAWYQEDQALLPAHDRIYANRYQVDASAPLTPSTTLVDFGSVTVDVTSGAQSITVTNDGDVPVAIRDILIEAGWGPTYGTIVAEPDPSNTHFNVSNHDCKSTLAPNTSCTIDVTFTPKSASAHFAELVVGYSTAGTELRVRLKGTGTAVPSPDPDPTEDDESGGGADPWLPLLALAALLTGAIRRRPLNSRPVV